MPEDFMFREEELLKEAAPLPVLSSRLRSRVLAAAIEAQDRRAQGRRVLASTLGLFAMMVTVAWLGPFANGPLSNGESQISDNDVQTFAESSGSFGEPVQGRKAPAGIPGKGAAGGSSTLSSLRPVLRLGQGLMSVMGDDWRDVEAELQSRQDHFAQFHM
jgi:hypothetical protein